MCQYCGHDLRYNYILRDANGKHSVVGCDCVKKSGDAKLVTVTEAARLGIERETRRVAKAARIEREHAARMESIAAIRAEHGETIEERRDRLHAEATARCAAATAGMFADIIAVLQTVETNPGDFVSSILNEITAGRSLSTFPPRAINIIGEVYARAKTGKRKNTAPFIAAQDAFFAALDAAEPIAAAAEAAMHAERKSVEDAYWNARKSGKDMFTL